MQESKLKTISNFIIQNDYKVRYLTQLDYLNRTIKEKLETRKKIHSRQGETELTLEKQYDNQPKSNFEYSIFR